MKKLMLAGAILLLLLMGFWLSLPKLPLLQGVAFSKAVYAEQNTLLRLTLNKQGNYQSYVSLNYISPLIIKATLLQEDRYYFKHFGFNPIAMVKAFVATYFTHDRRYGASTIPMQVARMRFNLDSKTIIGKLQQLYDALALEKYYSKNQILQAYFNLAPYGGNIQGIKAASLIYFHTAPDKLSLPQALALAVIPQNPVKRMPVSVKNIAQLIQARNRLFLQWQQHYPVSQEQRVNMDLPLQVYARKNLPFLAPHFVDYVLQHQAKSPNIHTSLSWPLQRAIENVTRLYLGKKTKSGINNVAVLLVDTHTMQIKAMLGSANFSDTNILGQINGVFAKRSPGSTLKPFIYALALEQGLITPMTVLKDVPMRFQYYQPENIDDRFLGPITAERALLLSRNIPAVYLESQLGQSNLYRFLTKANISQLKNESYYGLSLVLGGGELSMFELVKLYAVLANQGLLKNINYLAHTQTQIGKRLLIPEASFITLDMLQHNPPPGMIANQIWNNQLPSIAWKTGTSSAYRDAWSIGVFSHYVIAVWMGDFNPKTNLALSGYKAAAPLMFQLIQTVNETIGPLPSPRIDLTKLNLKKIPVCEASGLLPGEYCPKTIMTWFIPGVSSIKKDTVYRAVPIDHKTGLRSCQLTSNTEFKVYEFWPSDVLSLFEAAGIKRNIAPDFAENCQNNYAPKGNDVIKITSPMNQLVYRINSKTKQLPLSAISNQAAANLYWFVDKHFYRASPASQTIFWPLETGNHTFTAMDQQGNIANVTIDVLQ